MRFADREEDEDTLLELDSTLAATAAKSSNSTKEQQQAGGSTAAAAPPPVYYIVRFVLFPVYSLSLRFRVRPFSNDDKMAFPPRKSGDHNKYT